MLLARANARDWPRLSLERATTAQRTKQATCPQELMKIASVPGPWLTTRWRLTPESPTLMTASISAKETANAGGRPFRIAGALSHSPFICSHVFVCRSVHPDSPAHAMRVKVFLPVCVFAQEAQAARLRFVRNVAERRLRWRRYPDRAAPGEDRRSNSRMPARSSHQVVVRIVGIRRDPGAHRQDLTHTEVSARRLAVCAARLDSCELLPH